jgi:hypothetical protein
MNMNDNERSLLAENEKLREKLTAQAEELERLRAEMDPNSEGTLAFYASQYKYERDKQAAVIEAVRAWAIDNSDANTDALLTAYDALTTPETRDKPIHIEANPYMAVEHSETGEQEP